jgi:hypothetical protein
MNKLTLWILRILAGYFIFAYSFGFLLFYSIEERVDVWSKLSNEMHIPLPIILFFVLVPLVISLLGLLFSQKIADYLFPLNKESSATVIDETSIIRIIALLGFILIIVSVADFIDISYTRVIEDGTLKLEALTHKNSISIHASNLIGIVIGGLLIRKRKSIAKRFCTID